MYRLYPTLVEQFMNYKRDLYGITEQDIIDKINRVPTPTHPAAAKGSAFHEITEGVYQDLKPVEYRKQECYKYGEYYFPVGPVREIGEIRRGGVHEVFAKKVLETRFGPVEIYGYCDTLKMGVIYDVKTTSSYRGISYLNSLQRHVYPWLTGARELIFLISTFQNVFIEPYGPGDEEVIRVEVEDFLTFAEQNLDKITDDKFLGL